MSPRSVDGREWRTAPLPGHRGRNPVNGASLLCIVCHFGDRKFPAASSEDLQVTSNLNFYHHNGKIELGDDDILAIQNLYGKPQNIVVTPVFLSNTSISLSPSRPVNNDTGDISQLDLCHFKNITTLLIAKKRMYNILYGKLLWIVNTNDMTYYNPIIITEWLRFLPKNFSKVLAVYQLSLIHI